MIIFFTKKVAPWNKGKPWSEEIRMKISENRKGKAMGNKNCVGKTPWNKGLKGIQIAWNKGLHIQTNSGRTHIKKGQHLSPSTEFTREQAISRNKNPAFIRKTIEGRVKRPTRLEKRTIEVIQKYNLPYKYVGDGSFMIENKNPDFVNTNGEKIAIEVYNSYWKRKTFGDIESWKRNRSEIFAKYGWRLLFFDETQVNEDEIKKRIG